MKARLNARELTLVDSFAGLYRGKGSSRWKWMLAGLSAAGGGVAYATHPLWAHLLK